MNAEHGAAGRNAGWADECGAEITICPEFEALIPPLAFDERALLERSLLADGCRDPLLVWKWRNTTFLLDGHNRLAICRRHNIPFRVAFREFPDRAAAEAFIVEHQLGRRNLSPEGASYLRGKRYLAEKRAHGGDRRTAGSSDQSDHRKTAERLGEEYKVGAATIRRDGRFTAAVDSIAANCGARAKQAILARDTGLTRGAVARLAKMSPEEQKAVLELLERGKLPRQTLPEKQATITVPREPTALAAKLFRRLGAKRSSAILHALTELLATRAARVAAREEAARGGATAPPA
jgi:hypothetical protein